MKSFLSLLFLSGAIFAAAQTTGIIKGRILDTALNQAVANATITLMEQKDSSLVSFTMTDNNGSFQFSGVRKGNYRVLVTHVSYHNTSAACKLDDTHQNIDLGNIIATDRSKVLSEVVVSSEAPPVTLVGDTIQYNAGSFKTAPNASVEELLKKLPGVRVDKDGTIKAQGEKVQKVLVDGRDFFGNDPKIATKNLPADAIDKVQVFDKLSDQAQLTGFDDGNSQKTINLKLKADKKKGKFGKLNAGGGTDGRYEGKFNINSFKGAQQLSAIGMGNNTNAEGFSFINMLNFTGAANQLKNGNGNISMNIGQDNPLAALLGSPNTGINTTFGGGLNYNNLIGTKTDLQTNYFYSRFSPYTQSTLQRQYFLPSNLYKENSSARQLNNSHRLNFSADYQIDSFNSVKITSSIGYQQTTNETASDYGTMSDLATNINDGSSNNIAHNEGYNLNTNLLFRKKFHRKGRTFSVNMSASANNNNGNGSLQSITDFYTPAGVLQTRDSINQRNKNETGLGGYSARAVYTEPIFNHSLLEFSLGKGNTENTSSKTTYDYDPATNKFDVPDNALTNDFRNNYGYNNAGFGFRKQTRNYNYAAAIAWQQSMLGGKIISNGKDSAINRKFTDLLPTARFQYYFSRFRFIQLNYVTNTNQPSVTQLQPLPDNTNPLYVKLGNPNLKQEFTHNVRLHASFVNPYRNRSFFVFFTFQETQNKIVNDDRINSLGIDSVKPVNVSGVYSTTGNISWSFPVHFLKGSVDIGSDVSYGRDRQVIGDTVNNILSTSLGPDLRIYINPGEKLNLSLGARLAYSRSEYSIQSVQNSQYLNQQYSADVSWQLPDKFYFATDFSYTINGQHAPGFNAKVPLWNASISRQVLRFSRGEIKLSVRDILDQNVGISRTMNQNYIEDSRVVNLRRFGLISFTYNLSRTGATPNGMKIMAR